MIIDIVVVYKGQEMEYNMPVSDGRMTIKWLGKIQPLFRHDRCWFVGLGTKLLDARQRSFLVVHSEAHQSDNAPEFMHTCVTLTK